MRRRSRGKRKYLGLSEARFEYLTVREARDNHGVELLKMVASLAEAVSLS